MVLPKRSTIKYLHGRASGFSLVEVLVVVGMLALLSSLALLATNQSYLNYSFTDERQLLVTALQKARSESLYNKCTGTCTGGLAHGVHVTPQQLVLFQGSTYNEFDDTNVTIVTSARTVSMTGLQEVVFSPLSAEVTNSGSIVLADLAGNSSVITIGSQGQIAWTK